MEITTTYSGQTASTNYILNESSYLDNAAEISSDYLIKARICSPMDIRQFSQPSINEIWELKWRVSHNLSGITDTQMLHLPRDTCPLSRWQSPSQPLHSCVRGAHRSVPKTDTETFHTIHSVFRVSDRWCGKSTNPKNKNINAEHSRPLQELTSRMYKMKNSPRNTLSNCGD